MARIEYREMPNVATYKVQQVYSPAGGLTAAADMPFFLATRRCYVHQITVYLYTQGADANVQLLAWGPGSDIDTDAADAILSDIVDVGSGGSYAVGEIVTSDMGLAQQINDAQTADYANTTDIFDMDGQSGVDTPYELAPGSTLGLDGTGANIALMEMIVEVLISEQPM